MGLGNLASGILRDVADRVSSLTVPSGAALLRDLEARHFPPVEPTYRAERPPEDGRVLYLERLFRAGEISFVVNTDPVLKRTLESQFPGCSLSMGRATDFGIVKVEPLVVGERQEKIGEKRAELVGSEYFVVVATPQSVRGTLE